MVQLYTKLVKTKHNLFTIQGLQVLCQGIIQTNENGFLRAVICWYSLSGLLPAGPLKCSSPLLRILASKILATCR